MDDEIEFWPMKMVVKKVGLSQTEIYRRIADGRFPAGKSYGKDGKRRFWLSTEVKAWQKSILEQEP